MRAIALLVWAVALSACAADDYTLCEKACDAEHTAGRDLAQCLAYCEACIVGNDPRCDGATP